MKESPVRDLIYEEDDDNIEINDDMEDDNIEINDDMEDILKGVGDMNIKDDEPMEFVSDDEVDVVDVDLGLDLQNLGIEKSLEEIQEPEKEDNIKNISEVQREVLKCLGML